MIDAQSEMITTVVGTGPGTGGFSADGTPANEALVNNPIGIAFDSAGKSFYYADAGNNLVRRVAGGIVTTVAGTGVQGFGGDGQLATQALLNTPRGLALDADGNLYIVDSVNGRVRMVDTNGIITTIAGGGSGSSLGDGGPATSATLNGPFAVALDAQKNLYIADSSNGCVRFVNRTSAPVTLNVIDPVTDQPIVVAPNNIATIAGTGRNGTTTKGSTTVTSIDTSFLSPGISVVASLIPSGTRIVSVDATSITLSTAATGTGTTTLLFGDGVPATLAKVGNPRGVALVGDATTGDLFIGEAGQNRVRKVNMATGLLATFAGTSVGGFSGDGGPAEKAQLNQPSLISLDAAGNVYIPEVGNIRIRRVNVAAKAVSVNLNADGAGNVEARLEVGASRDATALASVRLRTVDASGQVTSDAVPETDDLGPDPADPTNVHKRVFGFGPNATLLAGQAFRLEWVFQDGKHGSGDTHFSISWSNPADITYGTPLDATQLTATASVPGTFTYSPAAGTVLSAGSTQPLTAHFVPDDATLGTADWTVLLNVVPRPITVTADNQTKILSSADPPLTYTITSGSFVSGDGLTGTLARRAGENVGTYTINQGTLGASGNYALTFVPGTLLVEYSTTQGRQVLAPLNADGSSVLKLGRTVPVNFQVFDADGVSVGPDTSSNGTAGPPVSLVLVKTCPATAPAGTGVGSTTPHTAFRWDPTLQQWVFNLSTSGLSSNVTYVYQINLNDGTSIGFQFTVK
jgi:sugar lactone lactonase YvrE